MAAPIEPETIEYTGFRDLHPDGVLEQPFYERYNSRLEMPISFAVAVLVPVFMAFLVIVLITLLPGGRNNNPVAITYLDGEDDTGVGSAGTGGEPEPQALGAAPTAADLQQLPKEADLSKVKEEIGPISVDSSTEQDISDATAAALATLNEEMRKKIAGQRKGTGKPGTGGNEGTGTGPGGTGADSTRARALRWVIKFDTRSGKDYLEQIGGLGGRVLLQVNNDNRRMYYFKDPRNPGNARVIASDSDLEEMSTWLRFEDIRRTSVEAVAEALNLGYVPPMFLVYFPKPLEEKLDKLERGFQNKNPKDVRETVFRVIRRGGEYDLQVVSQVLK